MAVNKWVSVPIPGTISPNLDIETRVDVLVVSVPIPGTISPNPTYRCLYTTIVSGFPSPFRGLYLQIRKR